MKVVTAIEPKRTSRTPSELWRALQKEAGLELWRSNTPGRDQDLEIAVFASLAPLVHKNLYVKCKTVTQLLAVDAKSKPPAIKVETLLSALLESQRGLTGMLREILDVLVDAKAPAGENVLSVQFELNDPSKPLHILLEEFRQFIDHVELARSSRVAPMTSKQVREIVDAIKNIFVEANLAHPFYVEGRTVVDWQAPPLPPRTGYADLDRALDSLIDAVIALRSWGAHVSLRRSDFYQAAMRDAPFNKVDTGLPGLMSDFFDLTIVDGVHGLAKAVSAAQLEADEILRRLTPLIEMLPRREEWVEKTITKATDLLALPIWKHRYELYSVWVGTLLLRTAQRKAEHFEFRPVNGILSFAFGGSCLAIYKFRDSEYQVWAELRSGLVGKSEVRKASIQPDFRVTKLPESTDRNADTCCVVESKHYLKVKPENFIRAANDYARSCPKAQVFVVNHGDCDCTTLDDGIEPAHLLRVKFLHQTQIDRDRGQELMSEVEETLFPAFPRSTDSRDIPNRATEVPQQSSIAIIIAAWRPPLQDVDLSIHGEDAAGILHEVSFKQMGSLDNAPFAQLRQDKRSAPGNEVIDIGKWHLIEYEVALTNYSGQGVISAENTSCIVFLNCYRYTLKPRFPEKDRWIAFRILLRDGYRVLDPGPATEVVKREVPEPVVANSLLRLPMTK